MEGEHKLFTGIMFLPVNREDLRARGWDELDIILVTGDAYLDHPSFGVAMMGRVLEKAGYRVGVIAMPNWRDPDSVSVLGRPRLFFGITSGNVDSMVMRFTAFKKVRNDDPYVPGGKAGHRPERAVIQYSNLVKQVHKDVPIVIGGIEASMRRMVHYDFWSNRLRRSIVEDSRADVLIHGMGEIPILEVAGRLTRKESLEGIPGTVIPTRNPPGDAFQLPSEENCMSSQDDLLDFYREFYRRQHRQVLVQSSGGRYLLHTPSPAIDSSSLDSFYDLPFTRRPHPLYTEEVPAFTMIRNSIVSHRGCVSGCSFCSLGLHQGKGVVSRSESSILKEVGKLCDDPRFSGHITDIGGPSANMYGISCGASGECTRESCLYPDPCAKLQLSGKRWLDLLDAAARIAGVKHVTVGSGIRFDLLMKEDGGRQLLERLVNNHVSGQLKIAPEHTSPEVLACMRKKPIFSTEHFVNAFFDIAAKAGKKYYLVPYLMSCHPGSEMRHMREMKGEVKRIFGFIPRQVQAFIPLPMTLSSIQYYTGSDPITGEKVFVERDMKKRVMQHGVFFDR